MISDMFTLGGWVMFFLGVFLGTWVKSLFSSVTSKVGAA